MKDKIMIFVIGFLAGAVVATGAFLIYTKVNNSSSCNNQSERMNGGNPQEMPNGQQPPEMNGQEPPEMPNGQTPEMNGQEPPEKPDGENNNIENKTQNKKQKSNTTE